MPAAPRKAQFPAGEREEGGYFNECQENSGERRGGRIKTGGPQAGKVPAAGGAPVMASA